MTYKKTHTSKTALESHISKIKARGGFYRVKGMTIEYSFLEPSGDTSIKSKNTADLIVEAANKGYRKVRVEFYPAYNAKEHKSLEKYPKLIASLKKAKIETFDVIEEAYDIVKLIKSPDVKSVVFTK